MKGLSKKLTFGLEMCVLLPAKGWLIEVLHGGHVAWQEQYNMGKNVHSNAKHFYCSWYATWLPCKNSIDKVVTIQTGHGKKIDC